MNFKDAQRFYAKINLRGPNGCHIWCGTKSGKGYGDFTYNGKSMRAHRFVYELVCDLIPDGLFVCHKCDNPSCVNPNHLFLGTNADNIADRNAKNRQARGEKHGSRTHPERMPHNPGERNGRAKLTAKQVQEIRVLHETGLYSLSKLGRKFGVNHAQINRIVHNRQWKEQSQCTIASTPSLNTRGEA